MGSRLCAPEIQHTYFILYDEVGGKTLIRVFLLLWAVYLKILIGLTLKDSFVNDFFFEAGFG